MKPEFRNKIGQIDSDPKDSKLENLTPAQQALRDAVINRFSRHKVNQFVQDQIKYINFNNHLADGLRILFDERGRPPANAPIQDIIAARKQIETEIKLLEAICSAMRNHLAEVKEIEEAAFELMENRGDQSY